MQTHNVTTPIALAIASCISFAAGYAFHLTYGFERKAAHQAIAEAQSFQRVAAAYEPIVANHSHFLELSKINTLDELNVLREKQRESTVRAAEFFIGKAASLELPEEKRFAEPFVNEATKIKASLLATQ